MFRRMITTSPTSNTTSNHNKLNRQFADFRIDWEQFLARQPADLAAALRAELDATFVPGDEGDAALATVVGRAAHEGDQAAARLVLRRVLPGLITVVRRRCRMSDRLATDLLHDVVATTWINICTYPLDRRPRKIAANLVRDAEYGTFVQHARTRSGSERPAAYDTPIERPVVADPHAADEVVELLTEAGRAGVDRDGLRLVGRLVLTGIAVGDLAEEMQVAPRTILNRRRATEQALADFVATA
jgi:hypothetical protein